MVRGQALGLNALQSRTHEPLADGGDLNGL